MIDCLIYFGVFALVFSMNAIAIKQKRKIVKKSLIILSFLLLLIFVGFRYNVGTDYESYLRAYDTASRVSWDKLGTMRMELLVAAIFKICSLVFIDARLVFLVLGFLMLWPIYKVNKLYDYKYLAYSVLMYCVLFLPFGLNGMRQGIAMSFMLLGTIYLLKNKTKFSIINCVIATLFHTSTLVVFPYIFLIWLCRYKKIKFTILNIILTTSLAIIVLFFLNSILISNGFTQYDYILGSVNIGSMSFSSVIMYLPIVFFALAFSKNADEREESNVFNNLTLSGIFFTLIGTAAQYLSRFGLFFLMPSIILVPQAVQSISRKNTRIVVKILLITYLVLFFYVQYSVWGKHEILPYQTWLFGGAG